jgi:hypothetical protein
MLDGELAGLYGVKVKALNQAVRRNADRFPDDFMFQLERALIGENRELARIQGGVRRHSRVDGSAFTAKTTYRVRDPGLIEPLTPRRGR